MTTDTPTPLTDALRGRDMAAMNEREVSRLMVDVLDSHESLERDLTAARQRIEGLEATERELRRIIDRGRESNATELGLSAQVDQYRNAATKLLERAESAESRLAAVEAERVKERDAIRLATIEEAAKKVEFMGGAYGGYPDRAGIFEIATAIRQLKEKSYERDAKK